MNQVALLIDFDNLFSNANERQGRALIKRVIASAEAHGRIALARAYADWGRWSHFKRTLLERRVTLREHPNFGSETKNRADIAIAVDAMRLLTTHDHIDTFVLVSGDSDYTPLVLALRGFGRSVHAIGPATGSSKLLQNACDSFEALSLDAPQPRRVADNRSFVQFERLRDLAIRGSSTAPGPLLGSVVVPELRQLDADFSYKALGFEKLIDFVNAAQDDGYVRVQRDKDSASIWYVLPVDGTPGANGHEAQACGDLDYASVLMLEE